MASSIDPTKPTEGSALTSDVRANFSTAKTEIEALQTDKAALADLASTATDDGTKGFNLVYYPPLATETPANIENHQFHYNHIFRYIPLSLHAGIIAGTSTTDVSTYFQNAIDHLKTAGGGELILNRGRYRFTSLISMVATSSSDKYQNIIIRGEGKDCTILEPSGSFAIFFKIQGPTGASGVMNEYITLKDFSIDGTLTTGTMVGLYVRAARGCLFENLNISIMSGDGIQLSKASASEHTFDNTFRLVRVQGCGGNGVGRDTATTGSPVDNTFDNCYIQGNTGGGYVLRGAMTLLSGFVGGNGSTGIDISYGALWLFGTGCENNQSGAGGSDIILRQELTSSTLVAPGLAAAASGTPDYGITVGQGSGANVENTTIISPYESGTYGTAMIRVNDGSNNCTIINPETGATITQHGSDTNTVIHRDGDSGYQGGYKQVLSFYQDNVPANQTSIDANKNAGTVKEYVMPYSGSIIACAIRTNDPRTAGSVTAFVAVNGTPTSFGATLNGTDTTQKLNTQVKDTDSFSAGDRITVELTSTGWAPTTADITIDVAVEI